jgi:hypothetical protein
MTKCFMRITCWISKAEDTHSEYVLLTAFPLQQRLQERAPVLRYAWHCSIHKIKTNFLHIELILFLFIHLYQLNMVF